MVLNILSFSTADKFGVLCRLDDGHRQSISSRHFKPASVLLADGLTILYTFLDEFLLTNFIRRKQCAVNRIYFRYQGSLSS